MCVEPIMLFQSIEVYEIALLHLSLTNVQQTEHSTIFYQFEKCFGQPI